MSALPKENKVYLTKKEIKENINLLAKNIIASGKKYDYVVGIARGGLHVSRPLSKKLKVPHTDIRISFYNKCQTYFPQIVDLRNLMNLPIRKNILIVDDLIDAGHTVNWLNENVKEYFDYDIAVMYLNEHNRHEIVPTYFASYKPNAWIVFPWEKPA